LDAVGDRWALLIVRDLLFGPKRFTDLRAGLPGIGTNILTARLRGLEAEGVVVRRELPPPAATTVYELTEHGHQLEQVLLVLGRWGLKTLPTAGVDNHHVESGWIAIALKACFRPELAPLKPEVYQLRLRDPGGSFYARVGARKLALQSGEFAKPDLRIETEPETLAFMLARLIPAEEAVAEGQVRLKGDIQLLHRFVAIFGTPPLMELPAPGLEAPTPLRKVRKPSRS
jgi:DNA-binding HxlR family transcriptional regulator